MNVPDAFQGVEAMSRMALKTSDVQSSSKTPKTGQKMAEKNVIFCDRDKLPLTRPSRFFFLRH